jgi:murein DD-endopeptidase MepM/ murein hydrolase activator NlpD
MSRAALLPALALLLTAAGEPQAPATAPERETEHVVLAGETLFGIANRARVPRVLIIEANGLKAPYAVRAGQKLKIPRTRQHTVVRGETGFTVAYTYAIPWRDIAIANSLDADAPLRPGQKLLIPTLIEQPPGPGAPVADAPTSPAARFAWPVAGPVRRGFVSRDDSTDYHDGLDITAREGTAVRAAAAGKVLFAGTEPKQFGNLVVVDHGDGWATAYAFLSRITVAKDEEVRAGERIGLVGHTGKARGSELHFELRRNNRPMDPAPQLAAVQAAQAAQAAAASAAPRTRSPSSGRPAASSRSRAGAAASPAAAVRKPARPRE